MKNKAIMNSDTDGQSKAAAILGAVSILGLAMTTLGNGGLATAGLFWLVPAGLAIFLGHLARARCRDAGNATPRPPGTTGMVLGYASAGTGTAVVCLVLGYAVVSAFLG